MMTPQKPKGSQAQAKVKVMVAMKALTLAASEMDPSSKEFQACIKASMDLAKVFGKNEEESQALMPAEVMQVMQGAAGPGAPPKPPGGAPPGGAPPPPMQ
jgi:hypothetical protein